MSLGSNNKRRIGRFNPDRHNRPSKDAITEAEIFRQREPIPEPKAPVTPPPPYEQKVYKERNKGVFKGKLTEEEALERIEFLNDKITNLVFMFGDVASSKTTVLSALSTYFRQNYLIVENSDNSEANKNINQNRNLMKKGRFPKITDANILHEYDIACRKSREEDWLNLTFIEMSGEYHREVSFERSGKLPREVEIYVRENELPLVIFLVIGYEELMRIGAYADENIDIDDQDTLTANFINYLTRHDIVCENIGIIITKFDRDKVQEDRLSHIQPKLKETLKQIENISASYKIFPFSVGKVRSNGWTDGDALIEQLDLSDCKPIIEWIIENFEEPQEESSNSLFGRIKRLFFED
ncbi:hypothetical protein [Lewinella sp. LCG006]|uniref:hypothetical protein n=1 Tax=Lewinella sp. LCG006 TaxID=3231911 RepID=UPI00345FAF75